MYSCRRSADCSPTLPPLHLSSTTVVTRGRGLTHAHEHDAHALVLTHRPGDMCRPVPMGVGAFPLSGSIRGRVAVV
eukprot:4790305-Prymnesium_polylepis.1